MRRSAACLFAALLSFWVAHADAQTGPLPDKANASQHAGKRPASVAAIVPPPTPVVVTPEPVAVSWYSPLARAFAGTGSASLIIRGAPWILGLALLGASLALWRRRQTPPHSIHRPVAFRRPPYFEYAGYETQAPPVVAAEDRTPEGRQLEASTASAPLARDFEPEPFLDRARQAFLDIQRAFDHADYETLDRLLTREMFSEARAEIIEHGPSGGTEVSRLAAELVRVRAEGLLATASVHFTGVIRRGPGGEATAFDEVWNLQQPLARTDGWRLASIHPLPA
jgi:predicted lipid-binding transport protein (Tim44 family)